ncbi:MAG: hypothetical protein PVS3B3_20990 [Ktedonobacteraceae bacterium]
MVLVWAGIRWFEKRTSLPGPQYTSFPMNGPTGMKILHQRYACGEIDAATFVRMYERLEAVSNRNHEMHATS